MAMTFEFKKATRTQARLRLALIGPAGSGKTYSSLAIATNLVPGGKVAVIDTEHGSASKYAGEADGCFAFDALELDSFSPETYVQAIRAAEKAGYDVLVIDSLSHAWMGKDGALEQVDAAAKRQQGNSFGAWRNVTPMHNALVEAIVGSRCHVIATMRSKTDYVQEKDERGKTVVRKVGLAPIQRDGLEYEFDVTGDIDLENTFVVSKTRCSAIAGKVIKRPGAELAHQLRAWLADGVAPPQMPKSARVEPVRAPVAVPPAPPSDPMLDALLSQYLQRITEASDLPALEKIGLELGESKLSTGHRDTIKRAYLARRKELQTVAA